MSCLEELAERRRLRAPREDRTALIDPPFSQLPTLLAENQQRRARYDVELSGRWLSELAQLGRQELLHAAHRYTTRYRDTRLDAEGELVFLSGHQPELFHPGVWLKNFALSRLGQQYGAVPVQLLIDTDTMKSPSIRVPTGTIDAPRVETVLYDVPSSEVPFEQRQVVDRQRFATFAERVTKTLGSLVREPLVQELWPHVMADLDADPRLGACLARGRHRLEGTWGLETLELPQSEVCRFESFRWFTAHLLSELPRVWELYNEGIHCYRQANRIRSRNHPAPQLEADGEWLEAPFWIFSSQQLGRARLFVRQRGEALQLTDRRHLEVELPLAAGGDAAAAVERLAGLEAEGVHLRSRALVTTMFARVVLSDLFLHGIGGGKYDELTDWLVRHLLGVEAPQYMVLSATIRLPIEHPRPSEEDIRHVDRQLRELEFNPDRVLLAAPDRDSLPSEAVAWIEQKRRWVQTPASPTSARERFLAIREANERLQPWVAARRAALEAQRAELVRALRAAAILDSREYSFCLYPEQPLRDFLLEICTLNT